MKLFPQSLLFIFACLFLGCSSDDENEIDEQTTAKTPSFSLIGEDLDNVYLFTFEEATENQRQVNLTEKSGINNQFIERRQVDDVVTFYSFSGGSFSAQQENVTTGETRSFQNFYTNTPERSIIWGTNSETSFFLAFFSPSVTNNLIIRTINFDTGLETELAIENNVLSVFQPVYYGSRLFMPYNISNTEHRVAVVDTENNTLLTTLDFQAFSPSVLIDDNGDLIIIKSKLGDQNSFARYDTVTLEVLEEREFALNRFFSSGPFAGSLSNNQLQYVNDLAQPSTVLFGPGVFDFDSNMNTAIDIFSIIENVETTLGFEIDLTTQGYSSKSNIFLVGYAAATVDNSVAGGILIISNEGELLNTIELPFVPTFVLQD